MKLLIVAQEVHEESPTLGFFTAWISELAKTYEQIKVICLSEGEHTLPKNVQVYSLGKEMRKQHKFLYALRFIFLALKLRHSYDAVFVHMNEEYLLVAGWLWKLLGKRVYLWRNHYSGTWKTDVAIMFATNVFCTSKYSYTAKFKKTKIMPVGVDLSCITKVQTAKKKKNSILFLARMAPSKRPEMLISALSILHVRNVPFTATLVGSPTPKDESHYVSLKKQVEVSSLEAIVSFVPSVSREHTLEYFGSHEIFVNCSPSGMFDKTLFEAAAAGCLVLAVSEDFAVMTDGKSKFSDAASLASSIENLLQSSPEEKELFQNTLKELAERESLKALIHELRAAIL